MPAASKTLARPRSLGSINNPLTLDSEDSDSDEIKGDDEEYVGPGGRRRASGSKRRMSSAVPARTSHKRKKSSAQSEAMEEYEEPRSPDCYRQPSSYIIPNIKQDPTWREAYERVEKVIQDGEGDKTTIRRARATHRRLLDEEAQWGIVEKGRGKQADGRCESCVNKGKACVVQLDMGGSHGEPYHVISSCIRCLVSASKCDILLKNADPGAINQPREPHKPPSKATPGRKPASIKPIPNHTTTSPSRPPPRPASAMQPSKSQSRSVSDKVADAAPRQSNADVPSKPKPDKPRGSNANGHDSAVGKEDVIMAVHDMVEFVAQMRTMSTASGAMKDLGTRGMFNLVDRQIELLQRFAEQLE